MFEEMTESIREETVKALMHVRIEQKVEREQVAKVTGTNKDDSAQCTGTVAKLEKDSAEMIRVHVEVVRNINIAVEKIIKTVQRGRY